MKTLEIKDKWELDWNSEKEFISIPRIDDELIDDNILILIDFVNKYVLKNDIILDIGCGDGNYHKLFKNNIFHGIDFHTKNFPNKTSYYTHNAEDFPYPTTQKYNFVTALETVEHLLRPDLFVEYIHDKILNTDGYLYITVPNIDCIDEKINNVNMCVYNPLLKSITKGRWTHGHIRYFDSESLKILFEDVGFKIISQGGCGCIHSKFAQQIASVYMHFFKIPQNEAIKVLNYVLPTLAPSVYILGQKNNF